MDGNITINIVEPGTPPSPTPIDPVTPNTGLFTSGIGGPEATIITAVSAALILTIAAIVVAILYRKQKKSGKVTKLVHLVDSTKAIITSKKRLSAALTAIALLVSAGTFVALAKNAVNASENDEQATEDTSSSSLTVDVSSEELTIEVGDEPVFAVLPVEVSVEEATQAGYTLTAYAEDSNLVSTTDPSNIIPMVTLPEPLAPNEEGVGRGWGPVTKLTDNTYGLALGEEPTSKDAEVYTSLSTDSLNPTIIKSMTEYTPTAENDTTTIYYGFYITPDTPYGTYTGSDIYYDATINTTLVTFDGNDLYFDGDEGKTTNEVEYIAVAQEESEDTINQIISGEYLEPSQTLPYIFLGWSEEQEAATPTYTSAEDIAQNLPILPNQPITLYAVWQKATELSFNGNGSDGGEAIDTRTIAAGDTITLPQNTFTREGYTFTGWNTESGGNGRSYDDEAEYTAPTDSGYVTLYAQWEELGPACDPNNICYRDNGANSPTTMGNQYINPSYSSYTLRVSNYQYDTNNDGRNDYGFAGWSADKNAASKMNSTAQPTIYGPSQAVTIEDLGDLSSKGLNLYAVWVSPAMDENNQPLTFQAEDLFTVTLADGSTLSSKPNGYVTALIDSRDDQVYTIAKLDDGNFWMIENLRLDDSVELNSENTHNPAEGFTQLPASSSDWCNNYTAECINRPYLNTSNTTNTISEFTDPFNDRNVYSKGNYYNWYSATAGQGTYEIIDADATGDICPAGWRLPPAGYTDNTPGSQYYLYNAVANDGSSGTPASKLRSFPNNLIDSGSTVSLNGGSYFSSTASHYNVLAYSMLASASDIRWVNDHGTPEDKKQGYSVRCIMQNN